MHADVKRMPIAARLGALVLFAALLSGCSENFSGQVVSADGSAVPNAVVQVNDDMTETDFKGRFSFHVDQSKADRYVFSVRKTGFGLLSRVYDRRVTRGQWVLTPGSVATFETGTSIDISDDAEVCAQAPGVMADFGNFPRRALPRVIDTFGQLNNGSLPAEVTSSLQVLFGGPQCSPGARLAINTSDLVDADGAAPKGPIKVTIATVDRYSPFSMPGDGGAETTNGIVRMETWGAATVLLESNGRQYQPAPGKHATLQIPLRADLLAGSPIPGSIPDTIPFLTYDEGAGIWRVDGEAQLNAERNAYVAKVEHFSAFNTDLIKQDPACLRVNGDALTAAGINRFGIDAFIPLGNGAPEYRYFDMTADALEGNSQLHAIYNLPANAWLTLVATHNTNAGIEPIGIYAINTGNPMPAGASVPPAHPYTDCANELILEVPQAATALLQASAVAPPSNDRPVHIYSPVKDNDPLPIGPDGWYSFALFDTAADLVVLPDVEAGNFGMNTQNVAHDSKHVSVRVNGLPAVNPVSLFAPGFANGPPAELQVNDLRLAVRPSTTIPIPLIGAPIANRAVVYIEPYTTVTRGPYAHLGGESVSAMHLQFLDPQGTLPNTLIDLELEKYGSTEPALTDQATRGQRYFLRRTVFVNDDDQFTDIATQNRFLFDTGTQYTIVNNDMAESLGIDTTQPGVHDCFPDLADAEGYLIDAIEFADQDDPDTIYRVAPALVCVDKTDSKIFLNYPLANGALTKFNAVIGMHPFSNVRLLFDGPGDRLGVSPQ